MSEPAAAASHVPVMLDRVLALLEPVAARGSAVVVDATIGLGGHAAALLARHPDLRLIGIDRDAEALARSRARLAAHSDRLHARARGLRLARRGPRRGRTSTGSTGCCSTSASPRCSSTTTSAASPTRATPVSTCGWTPATGRTAADVVNTYPVAELSRVLRDYGEERFARRIAQAIDRERSVAPLTSSRRLAELVRDAIPAATRRTGGHPAKRTFQALRIEVNDELGALERALPAAVTALRLGGRLVVLAYQSLEDRIVKRAFAAGATTTAPPDLPVVPRERDADPAAAHPRRRKAGRRERSPTTPARPRSGCVRSNASGTPHE